MSYSLYAVFTLCFSTLPEEICVAPDESCLVPIVSEETFITLDLSVFGISPPSAELVISQGYGAFSARWFDDEEIYKIDVYDGWLGVADQAIYWACSQPPYDRAWRLWQLETLRLPSMEFSAFEVVLLILQEALVSCGEK